MDSESDKMVESNKNNRLGKNNLSLKRPRKTVSKYPNCHWCSSPEIKLVPVSSLVNLKLGDMKMSQVAKYQKLWQKQGWPTNRYLCWVCRLNCELAKQGANVWLCPGCRKALESSRK